MEQIEKATGKQIIRIETNDLDEMETVSGLLSCIASTPLIMCVDSTANEEGIEVIVLFVRNHPCIPVSGVSHAPPKFFHYGRIPLY